MVESIVTVLLEVVKCFAPPTERQLGYLRNYKANFENLKAEIDKLKDESKSIQHRVSEAERKGEKIEEKVENWLTRYQLSKKAETEVKALVELKEEARRFDDRIFYRTIAEEVWLKSNKGYEAIKSRLSTLKSIQDALTDVNVSIVGVYSMGGIGKTTLVKEFARQASEEKLFDQVVFSEVSQTPDIKKIQGEIAEKLGLELSEEAESGRASRLYERLKKEKMVLVILDNIWKYLDLETVGIPFGDDHRETVGIPFGDDHRGCKLLLTARDRNVLLSMGSENNFLIGILNEQEAWRLFKMMAVAKALRNKEQPMWRNALQELQTPSEASFDEGVPVEAYSTIELSYNMGLGAFESVYKLEDAHNKLHAWVHQLRDSCLLLEDGSSKFFSMHDVVRDVAISIARRDKIAFAVRNEDVWNWPDADALKKYFAICLKDSIINDIPEVLESTQLEFLFMSPKNSFVGPNVPENFFKRTKKLRVLDLTRMRLLSSPSSIDLLVNLRTLCLNQSILGDMDTVIIGKLENLEILSFVLSDIVQLPKALGQLTKLRLLDLRDCFHLKVIAPNALSSLIRLEELYMGFLARKLERFKISIGNESFMPPKSVTREWFQSRPHFLINSNRESLRELKLKLDFMDICSMKLQGINNVEYLWLDKLQGVKNVLFDLDTEGFSQLKHLHVQNNPNFLCIVDSMEMVACEAFPLLESLILHNLINMERICIDQLKLSTTKCLPRLERIAVVNCNKMKEIFAIMEEVDNAIEKIEFAQLRSLSLGNLPEVTNFCREVKTPSASPNRPSS
ncbi:AAA domain-containing protein [Citrus sinensis]|nr:AAA domain-containing protein [Citrus sinensis]